MAQAMGGQLYATSPGKGKGSTFILPASGGTAVGEEIKLVISRTDFQPRIFF